MGKDKRAHIAAVRTAIIAHLTQTFFTLSVTKFSINLENMSILFIFLGVTILLCCEHSNKSVYIFIFLEEIM